MRTGADPQVQIRLGEIEFIEEDLRHPVVVVLAGMHQVLSMAGLTQCSANGCSLYELRPNADNGQHLHAAIASAVQNRATSLTTAFSSTSDSSG